MGSYSSSPNCTSTSRSSQKRSYTYEQLPKKLLQYLEKGQKIINLRILTSPMLHVFQHHQIIFQIKNNMVILSFNKDGLQCVTGIDDEDLINRRPKNRVLKSYTEQFDSKKLVRFLKQSAYKTYSLRTWNCNHFVDALIIVLQN